MTTEAERKLATQLLKAIKAVQPSRSIVGGQLKEKIAGQTVTLPLYNSSSISESRKLR